MLLMEFSSQRLTTVVMVSVSFMLGLLGCPLPPQIGFLPVPKMAASSSQEITTVRYFHLSIHFESPGVLSDWTIFGCVVIAEWTNRPMDLV